MVSPKITAWLDLTRAHFAIVWPVLFCSGLALAFYNYGGFSWSLTIKAAFIGLFGFVAGLVLNDYVDRHLDRTETPDNPLTRYWRPFGTRPIPQDLITSRQAFALFIVLAGATTVLIATLPAPHSIYVFIIMLWSYGVEVFYQIKKRNQKFPVAQLVGRTDLTLFPIAGYLCVGQPDMTVLFFAFFFYPFALAHLGVNDLADMESDHLRKMKTIGVLYGAAGCVWWIFFFTLWHLAAATFFVYHVILVALPGFLLAFILLCVALLLLWRSKDAAAAMKALPLFHAALFIEALSLILATVL